MRRKFAFLLLAVATGWASADFLDREVSFTEADVQASIDKSTPAEFRYGGLLAITLTHPPRITLGVPAERVGIAASMNIVLAGGVAIPFEMTGTAGIRYDDKAKAFFLEKPLADSLLSPALSKDSAQVTRNAATRYIASYFRNRPVYVLRENGTPQEVAARWLLKSLRVEPGKIVATLSPF